jgi:hypothetical protein
MIIKGGNCRLMVKHPLEALSLLSGMRKTSQKKEFHPEAFVEMCDHCLCQDPYGSCESASCRLKGVMIVSVSLMETTKLDM